MKRRVAIMLLSACLLARPVQAYAMEEQEVWKLAQVAGAEYGICPELLQAIAYRESGYREDAEGTGCTGLMQIAGKWHRERMTRLGVSSLKEPGGNMLVAADYLAELFERYGDPGMVLMVYNGDSGAEKYQDSGTGLSEYAQAVLEMSYELERKHGK